VTAATNHAYDQKAKGMYSYADFFVTNHPEVVLCGIRGELPNLHGEPKAASDTFSEETMVEEAPEIPETETAETAPETEPQALSEPETVSGRNPRIQYLEIQGYTFALLNYTYGTNLATYPSDAEGHLDMLCDYNRKNRMLNFTALNDYVLPDIYEAKQTSDFVIVYPHWGNEYQTSASPYQEAWAKMFADAGADLIIGCHPHVVQPVTKVVSDLGNEVLCYYSLGNYASLQRQRRAMFEAMAWVTLTDDEEGKLHIVEEESGALPMVMQYTTGARFQAVVPLDEYTESLAASHGIITRGEGKLSITDMNHWADTLLTTYRMTKEEILKEPTYFSGPVTE
jgi:poly-gamma-glutamate synthesis protein (capsule biosynthesis protein)